ncbi:lipid-binding SYLF domain-containing protein [Pseudodesulfovibrio sp. zrk46]|nr:lipid-binding SYLF domain-containing protein [Pseudodesulfovibrio sp. zrk46]
MLMKRRISLFALVATLCFLMIGCSSRNNTTQQASNGQVIVDAATDTLRENLEKEQNKSMASLIAQAKGMMIIPYIGNVSFFFSLGGGNAVVMARGEEGWTGPVFLSKGTAGLGIQAGVTRTSGVVLYMDAEDVKYVLETGAVLQGQAAITFLDKDYEGNRSPEFVETGDVVFIGDVSGLFAGIGVAGGGLSNRNELNAAYHGVEDGNPESILFKSASVPQGASALLDLLNGADAEASKASDDKENKKGGTDVPPSKGSLGVSDGT